MAKDADINLKALTLAPIQIVAVRMALGANIALSMAASQAGI